MNARRAPMSKASKPPSATPGFSGSNPFDSGFESEKNVRPARASSAPANSFNEDDGRGTSSYSYAGSSAAKNRYKNDFRESGGFENQSVQELENYAVYRSEETTQKVNNCLKIAEEMKEGATQTLVTLHQQGDQIRRTHDATANIEYDLSRGEKLLGSLGGIFSKTWKPKKNRQIKGPRLTRDDSFIRNGGHLQQRQKLGLLSPPRTRSSAQRFPSESASALEKVELEKKKQDDTLSDVSDILGQLKEMAVAMGSELESQNTALGHFEEDVDEVHFRVHGAKERTRRLLGR